MPILYLIKYFIAILYFVLNRIHWLYLYLLMYSHKDINNYKNEETFIIQLVVNRRVMFVIKFGGIYGVLYIYRSDMLMTN